MVGLAQACKYLPVYACLPRQNKTIVYCESDYNLRWAHSLIAPSRKRGLFSRPNIFSVPRGIQYKLSFFFSPYGFSSSDAALRLLWE